MMAPEHLDAVAALEKKAGDVRWSRVQFEKELAMPASRFYVLIEPSRLVGYGGFWAVAAEAQITNLVIHPERRRQGLGRRLMEELLSRAREEACVRSTLEVRAGNAAALGLYRKAGFTVVGLRERWYQNPVEDAVYMEKIL